MSTSASLHPRVTRGASEAPVLGHCPSARGRSGWAPAPLCTPADWSSCGGLLAGAGQHPPWFLNRVQPGAGCLLAAVWFSRTENRSKDTKIPWGVRISDPQLLLPNSSGVWGSRWGLL